MAPPLVGWRERVLRAIHADLPRLAIGLYFINACIQGIELWARGNGTFPWFRVMLLGPAAAMMAPTRLVRTELQARGALLCTADLALDAMLIVGDVLSTRYHSGVWFVDELMVKKVGLVGCGMLLLLQLQQRLCGAGGGGMTPSGGILGSTVRGLASHGGEEGHDAVAKVHHGGSCASDDSTAEGIAGACAGANASWTASGGNSEHGVAPLRREGRGSPTALAWSTRQSVALLVGRVLLALLFMWTGAAELRRQYASVRPTRLQTGGKHRPWHLRPKGDGHDQWWAKVAELLPALPLALGLRTPLAAMTLGVACALEALVQWPFWLYYLGDPYRLGPYYAISAREHFVVNLAVAAGMLLLRQFGAGRFSVDELMKKEE